MLHCKFEKLMVYHELKYSKHLQTLEEPTEEEIQICWTWVVTQQMDTHSMQSTLAIIAKLLKTSNATKKK